MVGISGEIKRMLPVMMEAAALLAERVPGVQFVLPQAGSIADDVLQSYLQASKAKITVIKGVAGSPESDPLRVDGLSGATVTSNAVTRLMQFWLSDSGYGRFLKRFREGALLT